MASLVGSHGMAGGCRSHHKIADSLLLWCMPQVRTAMAADVMMLLAGIASQVIMNRFLAGAHAWGMHGDGISMSKGGGACMQSIPACLAAQASLVASYFNRERGCGSVCLREHWGNHQPVPPYMLRHSVPNCPMQAACS